MCVICLRMRSLFVVDVLAVLPHDFFLQYVISGRMLAMLRLNRLIGLIRVFKYLSTNSFY